MTKKPVPAPVDLELVAPLPSSGGAFVVEDGTLKPDPNELSPPVSAPPETTQKTES